MNGYGNSTDDFGMGHQKPVPDIIFLYNFTAGYVIFPKKIRFDG